jgi:hypothetical protein
VLTNSCIELNKEKSRKYTEKTFKNIKKRIKIILLDVFVFGI